MDRVRLGRVLGRGARHAARTAIDAVDAATAPASTQRRANPLDKSSGKTGDATTPRGVIEAAPRNRYSYGEPIRVASYTAAAVRPAARAAVSGIMGPLRHASRALWHELTGSFFALFAFSFAAGAWHTHTLVLSTVPADRYRFYSFLALALLFIYFSVSSFLRARRRSRG